MELLEGGKASISLKMKNLFQNPVAHAALRKIGSFPNFQPTTTIMLKTVLRELNETASKLVQDREDILKNISDKNENGEPVVENGQYKMSPDAQKQADELHAAFLEQPIQLPRPRLKFSAIQSVGLSADDLILLDGMIDEEA